MPAVMYTSIHTTKTLPNLSTAEHIFNKHTVTVSCAMSNRLLVLQTLPPPPPAWGRWVCMGVPACHCHQLLLVHTPCLLLLLGKTHQPKGKKSVSMSALGPAGLSHTAIQLLSSALQLLSPAFVVHFLHID